MSRSRASANTITLNDHLVLCTGSNFTTPVDGQQGYIVTGVINTDLTSIPTNGANVLFASITLSYGVWMVIGQAGYYNSSTTSTVTTSIKQISIHTVSGSGSNAKHMYRANYSCTIGAQTANNDQCMRIITQTASASTANYFLNGSFTWSGSGTLVTYAANTNFYAVRNA